jgi:hypothetical protein
MGVKSHTNFENFEDWKPCSARCFHGNYLSFLFLIFSFILQDAFWCEFFKALCLAAAVSMHFYNKKEGAWSD